MKKIGDKENYNNSIFENIKNIDEYGDEYWLARDLQKVLEYKDWRNFQKVIDKEKWAKFHHMLVLFGRYYCKSQSPKCQDCVLQKHCKYYKGK